MENVRWVEGSRMAGDIQAVADICKRLADEGRLNAASLVEEAKDEESPIHDMFEWDDSIAARNWREFQASKIIRSIEYVVDDKPVRYFSSVAPNHYMITENAMSAEDTRAILLASAKRELEAFTRKYARLEELADFIQAAKLAIQKL